MNPTDHKQFRVSGPEKICKIDQAQFNEILDTTLANLIDLNTNYNASSFALFLDYVTQNESPKFADVLTHLGANCDQSLVDIEKVSNKTIENILLDYIFEEIGIRRGQRILFKKSRVHGNTKKSVCMYIKCAKCREKPFKAYL